MRKLALKMQAEVFIHIETINNGIIFSSYINLLKRKSSMVSLALDNVFSDNPATRGCLVKDGPLTEELEAVSRYETKYPIFHIVVNEKNLGLRLSLKRSVEACSNEIIGEWIRMILSRRSF